MVESTRLTLRVDLTIRRRCEDYRSRYFDCQSRSFERAPKLLEPVAENLCGGWGNRQGHDQVPLAYVVTVEEWPS
jgi:hypothetical protein